MKKKLLCAECQKEFERDHWRIQSGKPNYCSRQCACRVTGRKPTVSWNKGLTKDNSQELRQIGEKISATHLDDYACGKREIWNKGLNKETDPRVAEAVRKQTNLRSTDGPWKDWWRSQMAKGQVKAHAAGKYPKTFTKVEKSTWAYMTKIGLAVKEHKDKTDEDAPGTWYHQYPVGEYWVADFACPSTKQIIECNGCFVHAHNVEKCKSQTAKYGWSDFSRRNQKRDIIKTAAYQKDGWAYALVWECEALADDFHRLHSYLGLTDKKQ